MKKVIQFPASARVASRQDSEAAAWIARLDRGELDAREQQALRTWLAADSRHRDALSSMAQLWGNLDCMRILAELFPAPQPGPRPVRQRLFSAGIAAVALVVLAVGLNLGGISDSFDPAREAPHGDKLPSELVYRTELGERSEIRLTDGSLLTLNTHSEARIRFDGISRAVYLTRGEAHFDVAKNPQLPFVVYAGQGQVTAVGTVFNVRLVDEEVEVLVSEGVVEVLAAANSPAVDEQPQVAPGIRLERGSSAIYTSTITRAEPLPAEKIEQRLAWRHGKWLFEGETLAEVLGEVSRYTDRQIIIADPHLAELRVGGYFDIGDIEGLMKALEAGFGIHAVRLGDSYRLQAASDNSQG